MINEYLNQLKIDIFNPFFYKRMTNKLKYPKIILITLHF